MSMPRRLTSRIFDSLTRGPIFHAGVHREDLIPTAGVRPLEVIGRMPKFIGGAACGAVGHCGGVGAAVARCLPTGSFTSSGELGLAWLGSPAAPICCLLDRVRRARKLLFVRPC